MTISPSILVSLLGLLLMVGCSTSGGLAPKASYQITYRQGKLSKTWAMTLASELKARLPHESLVGFGRGKAPSQSVSNVRQIHLELNSELLEDYRLWHEGQSLRVQIKREESAPWLVSELIKYLALQDARIEAADLDPPTLEFKTGRYTFDFQYRDPHFGPNLIPGRSAILGNHNVDEHWALWGHNLHRLLAPVSDESFYAQIEGKVNKVQYAFSDSLLTRLSNRIMDLYGEGRKEPQTFMIAPKDNRLVNLSPEAQSIGNTFQSATPEVAQFVNRLARRYKYHRFFMLGYHSTSEAPKFDLEGNVGVFLSTVNLDKGVALDAKEKATREFIQNLEAWKERTDRLYLWDYSSNFDDYLTPIPVLYALKKQLAFYKSLGIKGVFLNGSGYQYSSFQGVKTYVMSALLKDLETDVDLLVTRYYKKNYPQSGALHRDYYLNLERRFEQRNKPYGIYSSFKQMKSRYFEAAPFVAYYEALLELQPRLQGEEKQKVEKLLTALSFTRLQLAYDSGFGQYGYASLNGYEVEVRPEVRIWMEHLSRHTQYEDMASYKEVEGSLKDYRLWWESILQEKQLNPLYGVKAQLLSPPDEGHEDSAILTDGRKGFDHDYRLGWLQSSAEVTHLSLLLKATRGSQTLSVRFLKALGNKVDLPKKVEFYLNGTLYKTVSEKAYTRESRSALLKVPISGSEDFHLEIKIYKGADRARSIALDEIEWH